MNDRPQENPLLRPWKILISDDDRDVHSATQMALRGLSFRGRPLQIIDAYSGAETLSQLHENPDTAIIFLDVVMETDDAGLRAVQRIRESGFKQVRIIIRTGFPGQAPERQVIVDYDIHDYKEKTGVSVQKLATSVISALRAYADLVALENHRRGLMSVLESVSWFDFNTVQRYISGMLAEFSDIANIGTGPTLILSRPRHATSETPTLLAAQGDWPGTDEALQLAELPTPTAALITQAFDEKRTQAGRAGKSVYLCRHGIELVVFAEGPEALAQVDEVLLEVFLATVCQAISNQLVFAEMQGDRDAVLRGLALRAERWNPQAATELERLAWWAHAIARRLHATLMFPDEIDEVFIRDIGIAAQLHDLGNESIAPALLSQSTCYSADERKQMQAHVVAGVGALTGVLGPRREHSALGLAYEIIAGHHEHFDGSGYPAGVRGEEIPLAARLLAVADTYTAMTSPRPHRAAHAASEALATIKSGEGSLFDPRVVQAFVEIVERGLAR